jgi:hypothetical protein
MSQGLFLTRVLLIPAVALASTVILRADGQDQELTAQTKDDFGHTFKQRLQTSAIWKLQRDLMANYNPNVRPVLDASQPVNVSINFVLFNLIDLVYIFDKHFIIKATFKYFKNTRVSACTPSSKQDDKRQVLGTNSEVVLEWNDPFLSWNESEYGVNAMSMSPEKIWQPDIILYNR